MHVGMKRGLLFGAALVGAALCSSCFFDSRWFEARRAQASVAEHAKASELRATAAEGARPQGAAAHVLRVRAYATPRYASEVLRWSQQLSALLDDAGQVLGPTLDARLEIAGTKAWSPRGGEGDIDAACAELAEMDPGQGVDWVVGFVGSVPRVELSFHQLGVGRVLGKHIVLRAMNDAKEYDAIQQAFPDLDDEKRRALYHQRKRHKATAVLLHELGHTLGVPHERDEKTIMHPVYSTKFEAYSDPAATLMRLSLDHRLHPDPAGDQVLTSALIAHLERTSASWVATERDDLLARLRAARPPSAPPSAAPPRPTPPSQRSRAQPAAPPAAPPAVAPQQAPATPATSQLAKLGEADRALFEEALREQRAGRKPDAWSKAEPLFSRYPDVYEVQDLRCQLAM